MPNKSLWAMSDPYSHDRFRFDYYVGLVGLRHFKRIERRARPVMGRWSPRTVF
jgi:hypothetical protein